MVWILEFIAKTLFVFWFIGCWSVLLDIDHIWIRLGRTEPCNITHCPGRCFHHPIIFLVFGIVGGCFIFAPVYGLYVQVSREIGTLAMLFGTIVINTGTIVFLKWFDAKNGEFLNEREYEGRTCKSPKRSN